MLEAIHLKNVGPAPEMRMDLAPRMGLGKGFLLDVAWWVLTRTWAREPVVPRSDAKATIAYAYTKKTRPSYRFTSGARRSSRVSCGGRDSSYVAMPELRGVRPRG